MENTPPRIKRSLNSPPPAPNKRHCVDRVHFVYNTDNVKYLSRPLYKKEETEEETEEEIS